MKLIKLLLAGFAALTCGISSQADDTDIYLGAAASDSGIPLIMLTLDYRPNLGSSVCSDAASAACESTLGKEILFNLDLIDNTDRSYNPDSESDVVGVIDVGDPADPDDDTVVMGIPAEWSGATVTLFDVMRTVFKVVLEAQADKDLRVGMMISHENTCNGPGPFVVGDQCSNGAYVLKGYFDPTDTVVNDPREQANCAGAGCTNLDDLLFKLSKMTVPQGNLSHKFQGKEVYFELFRYLTGGKVQNGHLGFDDFGSPTGDENLNSLVNIDGNGNGTIDFSWDTDAERATVDVDVYEYVSPFDNDDSDWSCASNYAINTMFQVSQQEDDTDDEIDEPLSSDGNSGGLGLTGNVTFPDVIQHLNNIDMADRVTADRESYDLGPDDIDGDQNLTSYFISAQVNNTTNGYARAGGTKTAYELDDPAQLLIDFKSIFSEILSQSSIFVAASVPVSTFNRLEIADNVYFALFQAEEEPFWPGNVKKLKIKKTVNLDNSVSLEIVGKDESLGAFGADGRIKAEIVSHWTDTSDSNLDGDDPEEEANDGTDGRKVERGAAGQQIPGYISDDPGDSNSGDRQMYMEPSAGTDLVALDATDAIAVSLKSKLGVIDADFPGLDNVADATDAAKDMIRWIRGQDVLDEDGDGDVDDARPWMMADPMHSRPLALNYGATTGYSESNPQIRIIFGTNDGVLHFIENTTPGGAESGEEVTAFVATESLANVETLMGGATTPPHSYGIDGEPVALVIDKDSDGTIDYTKGDVAIVFIGMRRGGKSYYAFDVSNPAALPEMLWKIDNNDFSNLGMTFSTPGLAVVQYKENPRAALIFGGGYSGGWNADNTARIGKDLNSDDDTVGNAIYIVNAKDGELIWKATQGSTGAVSNTEYNHSDLFDSIPSTVAVYDSNNDDIHDRVYVGDTGGAVWRVDLPAGTTNNHRKDNWFVSKLAEFGTDGLATDRRFFHAPKPFRSKDGTGTFDGVTIGSGNRADPTETDVTNYFFLIKDRIFSSGSDAMRQDGASPFTPLVVGDLTDITSCLTGDCSVGVNGWKLELEESGEKGLSTAIVNTGEVFFTTFLPGGDAAEGSCAPSAGSGRLYIISAEDGKPTRNYYGTVEGVYKEDRYTTGTTTGIPSGVVDISGGAVLTPLGEFIETGNEPRLKVYWREEGIDQIDN